jgi:hypothetical protein
MLLWRQRGAAVFVPAAKAHSWRVFVWWSDVNQFDTADALCCCGPPALHHGGAVIAARHRQPPGDESHADHEYRVSIEYAAFVQEIYDRGANSFLLLSVNVQVP